ncbi:MAG: hypothetical protein ACI8ZN_001570 [Bacteroidia bacterium]|jgi:hypothetical protein
MSQASTNTNKEHSTRSIPPLRIFLMLLGLNFVLALIVLAFPEGEHRFFENGIAARKYILFGERDTFFKDGLAITFVSASDLFTSKERVVVDLDAVLSDVDLSDTSNFDNEILAKADSSIKEPELNKRIQYPANKNIGLTTFFKALYALEGGDDQLFRILHYGDSQLEGDRISDYLRNKMQLRFGGSGPGIVLPIDVSRSRISIRQSESSDWQKVAIYGRNRAKDGVYGLGGSAYRYTGTVSVRIGTDTIIRKKYDSMVPKVVKVKVVPLKTETPSIIDTSKVVAKSGELPATKMILVPLDSTKFVWDTIYRGRFEKRTTASSWLRFVCAKGSYPKVRSFERVSLSYTSDDTCQLTIEADGIRKSFILLPTRSARTIRLISGNVTSEVKLSFSGVSPTVLGVFLDGESGLAVDNFPMRGSSGTGFEIIRRNVYTQQLLESNTKLIIMQYGINVVPNPIKNYGYYERLFLAQLKAIKAANPEVSILVIGPSDMSRKRSGEYESYPNVPLIRDAMRNAAFQTDCVFWDLYSAMGGKNSMVSWVQNDPTLAAKDFTHFNSRGARYVGEMLYDAIMSEYLVWKKGQVSMK